MKPRQGKYLFYIGLALVILGATLWPFDALVSILSVLFGLWTAVKGYGVMKGRQPYLLRKHQEQEIKELEEEKSVHPFDRMKKHDN